LAVDPVCGMSVDEKSSKYSSQHRGQTYYFCSKACKDKFDSNPEKYIVARGS